MKILKVKSQNDECFLDLSDFADVVNISEVHSYTLEEVDNDGQRALILQFYDKNQNIVKLENNKPMPSPPSEEELKELHNKDKDLQND